MKVAKDNQDKSQIQNAGAIVVDALTCEKIDTVFGIVGSHVVGIYEALRRQPNIHCVSARHECSAAFMGAGYARITGNVSVLIVTAGPGALNAVNGIAQANFSALPMVIIAGGPPTNARPFELHTLQESHYCIKSIAPLVKEAIRPLTLNELRSSLEKAFSISQTGRPGPVYVEIPWDLFEAKTDHQTSYFTRNKPLSYYTANDLEYATKAIKQSSKNLIILDKELLHDTDINEILSLAETIGAGICVTRDALGLVDEKHACYRGVLHDHLFGHFALDAIKSADFVLMFGFDALSDNYSRVADIAGLHFVHFTKVTNSSKPITLRDVCDGLKDASSSIKNSFTNIDHYRSKLEIIESVQQDSKANLYLKTLCSIAEKMKFEDLSIIDAGNHEVWARTLLPIYSNSSCIGGANWASMGFAIPTAVAARIAAPEKRIVCITGDGCLLMSLADLSTFIEYGGPSILIILNDSEYGMMSDVQHTKFDASYETELPKIDYLALAKSMGGWGFRIQTLENVENVVSKAIASDKPFIVEVICERPPTLKFGSDISINR